MTPRTINKRTRLLASTAFCALLGGVATAQEVPDDEDTIIVVGTRQAVKTAEDIKRNADSIVDSVTATDIGAFPDASIAEALQRVPGISVARTASPTDVTHYAAEPTSVIIRGLTQTRSEFNGRDIFSANSSYGLNFEDISPVLLSRVDTYKNQTAEMIEGGIAGTINIVTRLPFDETGRKLSFSANANYNDIREETSPDFAAIYSDRWDTEVGEFGLLVSGTSSELLTTSRGVAEARTVIFDAGTYSDQENYIPSGVFFTDTDYDRNREGLSLAAQWRSPNDRWLATAQFNSSSYENVWRERLVETYWKFIPQGTGHDTSFNDSTFILPPDAPGLGFNEAGGGTPFTFQNNGMFGMGTINQTFGGTGDWGYGGLDWSAFPPVQYLDGSTDALGVLPNGEPQTIACLNTEYSHANQPCPRAVEVLNKTRLSQEERSIQDISLNLTYSPTDNLDVIFDYQRIDAETDLDDIVAGFRYFADVNLDLTGDIPNLSLSAPSYYNTVGDDPFADPNNYAIANIMDHITDSEGTSEALRIDARYRFDGSGWLTELRTGFRLAERNQEHKWSLYNWNTVSAAWNSPNAADSFMLTSGPTYNTDGTVRFQGYEQGFWETVNFGQDILGGGHFGNSPLIFMNFDNLADDDFVYRNFSAAGQTANGGEASAYWNPICHRETELDNSCFTQGEITDVTEESTAAFAMLKFGGDEAKLFDFPVTGNIGVRYVETTVESSGGTNFPIEFVASSLDCTPLTALEIAALPADRYPTTLECLNAASVGDQAFSSGTATTNSVRTTHKNWLPSFNMRVELGDQTYLRLAASRAISKPDIGLLKNYTALYRTPINTNEIVVGNPNIVLDESGNAVSLVYDYSASTSNPRLAPIKANQFDVSLEHYFEDIGSMTAVVFYKEFDDYIQNGTFVLPMTNNGVTRDVTTTAPVNGDGGSVKGIEVQYRRYFDDLLPAPFDGLGFEANYTRVWNEGVENSNLERDTTGEGTVDFSSLSSMINPGRLEQMSDHTANIVGVYEKDKIGARLAYNWRSEFLLSVNDCCIGFPVWGEEEGFLDGSVRYALTDNIELSLQASNLTDTRAQVKSQIKGPTAADPDQAAVFVPGTTFEYGRRFVVGIRANF